MVCAVMRYSFTIVIEMVAPWGTVRFSPRAVCTIFRGGVLRANQKPQTTNFADPVMIKPVLNPSSETRVRWYGDDVKVLV